MSLPNIRVCNYSNAVAQTAGRATPILVTSELSFHEKGEVFENCNGLNIRPFIQKMKISILFQGV